MKPTETHRLGDAIARQNPLTGDWLISGQRGESLPYVCDSWRYASQMLQTVHHYNLTGEVVRLPTKSRTEIRALHLTTGVCAA